MKGRVLIVDDEKNITFVLRAMLEKNGFEVLTFNDSLHAIQAIGVEYLNTVITDLYMPGKSGMEILEYCTKTNPRLPVVIITAYGTVEAAVSALKNGAFDFVTKPFDQSEFLTVIEKAVSTHQSREKEPVMIASATTDAGSKDSRTGEASEISSMIGSAPKMKSIFSMISKIARLSSTVLITGDSGTGKELVAYEIHSLSDRRDKPFIKVNCGAIPSTLIESELFGYEKGAFTGAVTSKPGRFELAHTGTLFLDEVGEMPLEMQVKLLRVMQEKEFERVGGVTTISVDVRIITATNKDLEKEVKEGRFREDLFYRLNVVPVHLPPLSERKEDIEILVKNFVQDFNTKMSKKVTHIDPKCLSALQSYSWPGNIRQLQNVVERMMVMTDGETLNLEDLPEGIFDGKAGETVQNDLASFKEIVRRQTQSLERELIERALEETRGNVTKAAEKLGLSRKGLQLKLKELDIRRQDS